MDELKYNKLINQLQQRAPIDAGSSRKPILPIPLTTVHTPAQVTTTNTVSPISPVVATRNSVLRVPKRVSQQQIAHQYMSSPLGTSLSGISPYEGMYSSQSYTRPFMNNMGIGSNYNQYNSYGQPFINPKFQNPTIIAASENSRPAFDSIWSVVQSFNAVSMMLETTLSAMQTSFQALLTVAENLTRLKMFITKLYSTAVTFKSAQWFLSKLLYLFKMVRGSGRETSTEDNVWAALSDINQVTPSKKSSWPVVVFTGLLVATPFFVVKLLNSVMHLPKTTPSTNNENRPIKTLVLKAIKDWSSQDPLTIPLVEGAYYFSNKSRLDECEQNGGWLHVGNANGQLGFVPIKLLKINNSLLINPRTRSVTSDISDVTSNVIPPNAEQIQPPQSISPIVDVHDNPIDLPHPLMNCDELKNDK